MNFRTSDREFPRDRVQELPDQHPWEAFGPTWAEIDLDALAANLTEIAAYVRRDLPEPAASFAARHGLRPPAGRPKVMVVVKGDGYGHGAVEAARAAVKAGADMLGVSTLAEALELRQSGLRVPILMFNPLTVAEARAVVEFAVTPTVTRLEAAQSLSAEAVEAGEAAEHGLPVHISVDTGMSRYGVAPGDLPGVAERIAALPGLRLEGLYTHFSAGAEQTAASLAAMRRQLERFARAVAAVEARGLTVPLRHTACSQAVVRLPESYLDLVRVGNLFYGFGPLPNLREAWRMKTRVLEVREVPAGTGVGYGPDVTVRRRARLATVPVGYADGAGLVIRNTSVRLRPRLKLLFRRVAQWLRRHGLLAGPLARIAGKVEVVSTFSHAGEPLDIVGRISMQQTVLDVTAHPGVGVGTVIRVRFPRTLASPRLARVYFEGGAAALVRTASGHAEAAAGWEPQAGGFRP